MNPFNFLIAAISFFFAISSNDVSAQCSNRIELVRTTSGRLGSNDGSIQVRITSTGSFEAKLIQLKDASEKIVTVRQGSGSETITFQKLPSDTSFRVLVSFGGEEQFLCRTKVLSDIVLNTSGN